MMSCNRNRSWALTALLAVSAWSGSASALTLPTTFVKADAVFQLSQDAVDALTVSGTSMSALGTAYGVSSTTQAFDLPVTKVDISIGLFPPSLNPVSGESSGAALYLSRGARSLALANFQIDFNADKVIADIISGGVTTKGVSIYDFSVASPLSIGLNGLTLDMSEKLNHLVLTDQALTTIGTDLALSRVLQAPLKTLDFGTINIDIRGALRIPPVSDKPFTVANMPAVPELPTSAMMWIGLCGVAAIARRGRKV